MTKVKRRCPVCGKTYVLGENGIKGSCDQCASIRRDANGWAIRPGENEPKQTPRKGKVKP